MRIGGKSHVVGEIPADMIRVVIDHDVVAVPEPVCAISGVEGCDREEECTHRKSVRVASVKPPDVARPDGTGKVTVFPGMVEMIVRIIAAGVMTDPSIAV